MERAACRCSDKEKIYDGSSVLSNANSHWCLSGLVRFWLLVSSFLRFMTLIKAMSVSIRLFYVQQVPRAVWTLQTLRTLGIATNLYSASTVFYYFISQTSQYVRYQFNCWLFLFFQLFTLHLCWRLCRHTFFSMIRLWPETQQAWTLVIYSFNIQACNTVTLWQVINMQMRMQSRYIRLSDFKSKLQYSE